MSIRIQDEKQNVVRTQTRPGTAGIHRVNWNLKRQTKVSDAEATRAGVTTLSKREALDWVAPGHYTVVVAIVPATVKNKVLVRKETAGVRVGSVRK
ncbi:MAG TPA: hypothetical protein VFH15_02995 [Pyrinomonadaceae bacterium]|nr:hypothetical protein [Pyrinomonadaceae bacterium]